MGFRTHDEDGALDTMSFDDFLIENKEATFMLRAATDSMRERGILKGDLVIVDRSISPRRGGIVLIAAEGEFKLASFDSIRGEDVRVEAVVTGIVRKYR